MRAVYQIRALACALGLTCLSVSHLVMAQEAPATETLEKPADTTISEVTEDEIIVEGQRHWKEHEGMKAFFDGDFQKAEIEFEREFLSLKRGQSALENTAIDAANNFDRAQMSDIANNSTVASASSPGGVGPAQVASPTSPQTTSLNVRTKDQRAAGRSTLTDGVVTYEDFAFSKYMSGLSEVKQSKYKEAKASFKTSLHHKSDNFDARMRLGLIYIQEEEFEKSAKQLIKLNKLRLACKKKSCEDLKLITNATRTLATALTQATSD